MAEHLHRWQFAFVAGAVILEPTLAANANIPNCNVIQYFERRDQFFRIAHIFKHPSPRGVIVCFLYSALPWTVALSRELRRATPLPEL